MDTHKWVPKTYPRASALKLKYQYYLPGSYFAGADDMLYLWRETPSHILVPRTANVDCDFVDLRPTFSKTNVKSNIQLDRDGGTIQQEAFDNWLSATNGVLNLACGKGKTVIALHIIATKKVPALIIVGTQDLHHQWEKEAKKFLSNFSLGKIKGSIDKWSWRKDIVIASAKSLSMYLHLMGPEFFTYFGIVLWDEAHHAPAKSLALPTDVFWGDRIGLTATACRGDGRDPILLSNIGQVFHRDLIPEIPVEVCFWLTPFSMDFTSIRDVYDKSNQLNVGKIRNYVGAFEPRNRWIVDRLLWLLERKNKVLAISHSKDQSYILRDLMEPLFPDIAVCTGDECHKERLTKLKRKRLGFGTSQLVREAIDMVDLDVLVILTPFTKTIPGENAIQQAFGRLQRKGSVDKVPWVIVLLDSGIPILARQGLDMMKSLRTWPDYKGGPISHFLTEPEDFPVFGANK